MERWQDIPNYKGFYQASNFGNIKSLIRKGRKTEINLQPGIRDGYFQVILCKNGKCVTWKVHQLILETFVGKCSLKMEIVKITN
jgi:hypothetical protein